MITICIGTYHRPELLNRCLSSLYKQSLNKKAFKVLIGDDGCCGEASTVAEYFPDMNIRVYEHGTNIGCDENFKFLMERVTTPYIMTLPDDEILYPDFLEHSLNVMEARQKLSAYYSSYNICMENGDVLGKARPLLARFGMIEGSIREWTVWETWAMCAIDTFIYAPFCLHRAKFIHEWLDTYKNTLFLDYSAGGEKIIYSLLCEKGRIIYDDTVHGASPFHAQKLSNAFTREQLRKGSRWVARHAEEHGFNVMKYWHDKLLDLNPVTSTVRNMFLAVLTEDEFFILRSENYADIIL